MEELKVLVSRGHHSVDDVLRLLAGHLGPNDKRLDAVLGEHFIYHRETDDYTLRQRKRMRRTEEDASVLRAVATKMDKLTRLFQATTDVDDATKYMVALARMFAELDWNGKFTAYYSRNNLDYWLDPHEGWVGKEYTKFEIIDHILDLASVHIELTDRFGPGYRLSWAHSGKEEQVVHRVLPALLRLFCEIDENKYNSKWICFTAEWPSFRQYTKDGEVFLANPFSKAVAYEGGQGESHAQVRLTTKIPVDWMEQSGYLNRASQRK